MIHLIIYWRVFSLDIIGRFEFRFFVHFILIFKFTIQIMPSFLKSKLLLQVFPHYYSMSFSSAMTPYQRGHGLFFFNFLLFLLQIWVRPLILIDDSIVSTLRSYHIIPIYNDSLCDPYRRDLVV